MSSNSARECFVYVTLPGKTSAVTAGKFVLGQTDSGTHSDALSTGKVTLKMLKQCQTTRGIEAL